MLLLADGLKKLSFLMSVEIVSFDVFKLRLSRGSVISYAPLHSSGAAYFVDQRCVGLSGLLKIPCSFHATLQPIHAAAVILREANGPRVALTAQ